jgi:hypothetical protein
MPGIRIYCIFWVEVFVLLCHLKYLCLQNRHEHKQECNVTLLSLMTLLTEYVTCLTLSYVLRFCLVLISFVFVVMCLFLLFIFVLASY